MNTSLAFSASRRSRLAFGLAALLAAAISSARAEDSASSEYPRFNNATITVVGDAGQNMASLDKYAEDWAKAGIQIKQVGTTFTGLYDKLKTDFVAGSGARLYPILKWRRGSKLGGHRQVIPAYVYSTRGGERRAVGVCPFVYSSQLAARASPALRRAPRPG